MNSSNLTPNEFTRDLEGARKWDSLDPLRAYRDEFHFPQTSSKPLYFAGHSLGLMPKKAKTYVDDELEAWAQHAVEGHFKGQHPWLPYHEFLTEPLSRLVGAKSNEVVAMNSLTVNLHLMMVSFYQPTAKRFKILIENNTFPSDRYAVESQARWHGFDPRQAIVELKPKPGEMTVHPDDVLAQIRSLKDELALVLLGNCNYLSGQRFDFAAVTQATHEAGAYCGFNLAHGAGNLMLHLHDWQVDFAVWCSYKYLNSGPGGIAGAFIHEGHHIRSDWPRFAGWWGNSKKERFKMGPEFLPIPTVEAWQLSNPPIFQLASHRASLELFDRAGMKALSRKSQSLTSYFQWLIETELAQKIEVITRATDRGAMLCLKLRDHVLSTKKFSAREFVQTLTQAGVFLDFREPNIIRATPAPLYNSFEDVFRLVHELKSRL